MSVVNTCNYCVADSLLKLTTCKFSETSSIRGNTARDVFVGYKLSSCIPTWYITYRTCIINLPRDCLAR